MGGSVPVAGAGLEQGGEGVDGVGFLECPNLVNAQATERP
jgi:hypothetical protein